MFVWSCFHGSLNSAGASQRHTVDECGRNKHKQIWMLFDVHENNLTCSDWPRAQADTTNHLHHRGIESRQIHVLATCCQPTPHMPSDNVAAKTGSQLRYQPVVRQARKLVNVEFETALGFKVSKAAKRRSSTSTCCEATKLASGDRSLLAPEGLS